MKPFIDPDKVYPLPSDGRLRNLWPKEREHYLELCSNLNKRLRNIFLSVLKDNPKLTYNQLSKLTKRNIGELCVIMCCKG